MECCSRCNFHLPLAVHLQMLAALARLHGGGHGRQVRGAGARVQHAQDVLPPQNPMSQGSWGPSAHSDRPDASANAYSAVHLHTCDPARCGGLSAAAQAGGKEHFRAQRTALLDDPGSQKGVGIRQRALWRPNGTLSERAPCWLVSTVWNRLFAKCARRPPPRCRNACTCSAASCRQQQRRLMQEEQRSAASCRQQQRRLMQIISSRTVCAHGDRWMRTAQLSAWAVTRS